MLFTPVEYMLIFFIDISYCSVDHWVTGSSETTYALLESLRQAASSDPKLSYHKTFCQVLQHIGAPVPVNISGLIEKVQCHVNHARRLNNLVMLKEPLKHSHSIGPACDAIDLTVEWLCGYIDSVATDQEPKVITNEIIVELNKYRSRHQISWENVIHWCTRLFPNAEHTPSTSALRNSWMTVAKKSKKKGDHHWISKTIYSLCISCQR